MIRPLAFSVAASVIVTLASATMATAAHVPTLTALYRGRPIPLIRVGRHHCLDAAHSTILCFDSAAARDEIARTMLQGERDSGRSPDSSVNYVTFFADINYSGASFTTDEPIADLGSIGWNDRISSFKGLDDGHPKWWRDNDYLGTAWQWAAGSWVANVGSDANDQFSSVQDVP